jgi:transcriptional regulator with XRE-family HTH domain
VTAARAEDRFAANLKALRNAKGMTQEDFVRAMARQGFKWHQATVYKVENGERPIQFGEAFAAANVLEVPLQEMIGEEPEDAAFRARLRLLAWKLGDARVKVVDAVYDYGETRRLLREALSDANGRLSADELERLEQDADIAAIRDWPTLRKLAGSQYEEAVFDAEA